MKLIVISPPDFIPEEVAAVNALLEKDSGFVFHLRKPEAERMEFEGYLKEINPDFYSRIMIHQHHSLLHSYPLKGLHYGGGEGSEQFPAGDKVYSKAVHSLAEIRAFGQKYDYYLLSPVFESISKKGYSSAFSLEEIKELLKKNDRGFNPVYALGGIEPDKISLIKAVGFEGVAVLGYLWENFRKNRSISELSDHFELLREKIISG
ncbi:MAG: thiamine phosphate synthase [Bacteroidia bacterium]|nr:thiamine phosphate synthase [Bacteroidia bacterium]